MEMIVSNIQQNRFHSGNLYSNYPAGKVTCRNAFELKPDTFVKNTPAQQVNFTGVSFFEAFIRNYLKQKAYKTSIRGSQRPYVSKDKDLAPLIRDVKIAVSPKEKINAWDINPKNSKDYVLFLHGFSQNITNNQPLYKELAKTKFGVLAIDYRGYGKNPPSANIQEEDIARDVAASIKYLKDSGAKNIGLIGHSFGAYIGAKVSDKIKPSFLIMVSPMNSLEFWLRNVMMHPKKYKFEMSLIKYVYNFKEQYQKVFDITQYLKNNKTDIYILQTGNDRYVKTAKIDEVAAIIPNLKSYTKIKGGGHRMEDNKINAIKSILDDL